MIATDYSIKVSFREFYNKELSIMKNSVAFSLPVPLPHHQSTQCRPPLHSSLQTSDSSSVLPCPLPDLVTDATYDFYGIRLTTGSLHHCIKVLQLDESNSNWIVMVDWKVCIFFLPPPFLFVVLACLSWKNPRHNPTTFFPISFIIIIAFCTCSALPLFVSSLSFQSICLSHGCNSLTAKANQEGLSQWYSF